MFEALFYFGRSISIAIVIIFNISSALCQNLIISDTSKVGIFSDKNVLPLYLDIDRDGYFDVVIENHSIAVCQSCTSKWIDVKNLNSQFSILNFDFQAVGLSETDTIKNIYNANPFLYGTSQEMFLQWAPPIDSSYMLRGDYCAESMHCSSDHVSLGIWNRYNHPMYIGVRKIEGKDTIAGWIKIGFNASDSIVQYAFEKGHYNSSIKITTATYKIYPTITKDIICIDNVLINSKLELFNNSGQVVLREILNSNNNRISLRNIKSGLYYIRINNQNLIFTNKIIKIDN